MPDDINQTSVTVTPVVSAEERRAREAETRASQMQQERDQMEARLRNAENERREARLAQMEPAQRMTAQIEALQQEMRERDARQEQERAAWRREVRNRELVAYRAIVLQQYGTEIIGEMVQGSSEQEIEQSAAFAASEYKRIISQIRQKLQAELTSEQPAVPQYPPQPQMIPIPVVAAPPPNPAYPAPAPQGAGWPTINNGTQVAEADAGQVDLGSLTSEEAVRNGTYSGQLRQQLLRQMKSNQPTASVGNQPRVQQQMQPQYVNMPGGVMQPQGYPTGPVNHPGMQQQVYAQPMPQYQPVPQQYYQPPTPVGYPQPYPMQPMPQQWIPQSMPYQQGVIPQTPQQPYNPNPNGYVPPRADGSLSNSLDGNAAADAIARTHAGRNPTMGQNQGAQGALAAAQTFAAKNGITSAAQAYNARFENTPPVTQTQPGQA